MSNVAEMRGSSRKGDTLALVRMHRHLANTSLVAPFLIYGEPTFERYLQAQLENHESNRFTTLRSAGRLVGFCHFRLHDSMAFLNNIFVDEDERGTGAGLQLLSGALERLPSSVTNIELDVFRSNSRIYAWYEKLGFEYQSTVFWSKAKIHSDRTDPEIEFRSDANGFTQLWYRGVWRGSKFGRHAVGSSFDIGDSLGRDHFVSAAVRSPQPAEGPEMVLDQSLRLGIGLPRLRKGVRS